MKPLELSDIILLKEEGYKFVVQCCTCSEGQNPLIYGRMELYPYKTSRNARQMLKSIPAPADPHDAPVVLKIKDAELEEMVHADGIEFLIYMEDVR